MKDDILELNNVNSSHLIPTNLTPSLKSENNKSNYYELSNEEDLISNQQIYKNDKTCSSI